ncbi:MAG: YraN family protein [Pseudomonadota bacterium]
MSGSTRYHAGAAAEAAVEQTYTQAGYRILARRLRTKRGEIDLIAEKDGVLVFVEVKKSKSFAEAAARLSARQMTRIAAAAEIFLASQPDGLNSAVRFDVALLDGKGQIEVLENAFGV